MPRGLFLLGWFGCISVSAGVAADGFALTATHFFYKRLKKVSKKTLAPTCGLLAGARGSFAAGLIRGASPPVCCAAPPLDVFGFAKRSLRSHPRINPSTQPSDVARGSRSRAAAELTLILLSGEEQRRCAFCYCFLVGASLLAKAACQPTHFLQVACNPCGSLSCQLWRPVSR